VTVYQDTLRSGRWKQLKWRRIMHAGFRCEHCDRKYGGRRVRGAMRSFHLHHLHYDTVGHESMDDVRVLCPLCHSLVHDRIPEAMT
jgi:predicted HNH restriction endonuclease